MIQLFDNDDTPYLRWLDQHPAGFVLNCERAGRFACLHAAVCSTIRVPRGWMGADPFTSRDYIKVCADTAETLRAWADRHGKRLQACKLCAPA